jgi:hypothetical protein
LANAIVLTASGGSLTTDNTGATTEQGEPDKAGDRGGASLWYSWTPNFDGVAEIDTSGSSVDTLLGMFIDWPGGAFGLSRVASNDDIGDSDTTSRVCTYVSANTTTYRIAVDGYSGATGPISLHWGKKTDSAPCPMIPPSIGGPSSQPKVGDLLFLGGGNFVDGGGTGSIQWLRCVEEECIAIDGATGGSYTVAMRDVGTAIRVDQAVTNQGGSAHNTSDPTGVVATTPHTGTNGRIFWSTYRDAPDPVTIHSMFGDTSGQLRVTSRDGGIWSAISPDGTQVAYIRGTDIAVANADGSDVIDLGLFGTHPTWSPDGSRLAYLSPSGIDVVDLDDPSDVVHVARVPSGLPSGNGSIDWSPDGTKIAFGYRQAPNGHSGIAVVRADGRGSITPLTTPPDSDDENPAWSPDGSQIAFDRLCGGVCGGVYVMDADGGNLIQLFGSDPAHVADYGVDWSPDGKSIVFSRRDDFGQGGDLFTLPAGGGSVTRLTNTHGDAWPTWGPLASFELSVSRSGNGGGTVASSSGGISCGVTCSATFVDPASVTLTATPVDGSTFAGWTGDCTGTGTCTLSMTGPHGVEAVFTHPTTSGGGGGGGGGGSSSLALSVTPPSQTVASGGTANWTISVTNTGGAYLYAVGVRDAAAPSCGIPGSFADTASLMAPGVTISYSCSLPSLTSNLTNTVIANATTGPGDLLTQTASATVTVQAPPAPPSAPQGSTAPPRAPSAAHRITGTNRADRLIGTAAADLINGLGGDDSINGGKGNDTLNGGRGNDTITGGPGHDKIFGGPSKDLINARDRTRDTIDCGPGRDIVTADKADKLARNCEVVHRV